MLPAIYVGRRRKPKMKPDEFKNFEKEEPDQNKWIIVTNNINAKDAHGEMSHVWLTTFWIEGDLETEGIITFDGADRKIIGLTHWKYA